MAIYDLNALRSATREPDGQKYVAEVEAFYKEHYEGVPIEELTVADYMLYEQTGDRKTYENAFFARRKRLNILQLLAIADDKHLPSIEEAIEAICAERSWLVPAHAYVAIDLFASETASSLAQTLFILKDKLSPSTVERARRAIYEKIISVYEGGSFWWEAAANNWSAVCASGIGLAYLYAFPERLDAVADRLIGSFEAFLRSMDDEGYCYEGVNYWQYGFANFCRFFLDYERMRGIRHPLVDSDKVKNTLAYVGNARMSEDIYLPFADGGYKRWKPNTHWAATIRSLYPTAEPMSASTLDIPADKPSCVEALYSRAWHGTRAELGELSMHYERAGVFIRRRERYSFAAKCGNNGELHNHNDVGAFQIVSGGERLICDFGAGLYTKEYFGSPEERYAIFACSAASHSIPVVDGISESYGKDMCGTVLERGRDLIEMDIAGAYDDGPSRLKVKYETLDSSLRVTYRIEGVRERVVYHFLSDVEPILEEGLLRIGNMTVRTDVGAAPRISREEHQPHFPLRDAGGNGRMQVVYVIDYETAARGCAEAVFNFEF